MKIIINLFIVFVTIKITASINCTNINFNDGQLHFNTCSKSLSRFRPGTVLPIKDDNTLQPRNDKTTHFMTNGNTSDICVETDFFAVDEFSYIVLGYYLQKLNDMGHGELTVKLYLDGNQIDEKRLRHNNAAGNWREMELDVGGSGLLLVSSSIIYFMSINFS